jgi:DnaJ domain
MLRTHVEIDRLLRAYRALDIDVRASAVAIRQRYRELARLQHPDRWPSGSAEQDRAADRMREINAAYDLIETAPLRDHVFATEEVAPTQPRGRSPIGQSQPSVAAETLIRATVGIGIGLAMVVALRSGGLPGLAIYGWLIPLLGLVLFVFSERHPLELLSVLRYFWGVR